MQGSILQNFVVASNSFVAVYIIYCMEVVQQSPDGAIAV